jgi:prepilin-type N-terminal cleavage/methylation domain-containing protein
MKRKGFTLVELLVGLMVTSIVLTSVATLAYALGSANDSSNNTSEQQAKVRNTTIMLSDLIRHCKLVCGEGVDDLSIWRADDNGDGQINVDEVVYIERGAGSDYLQFVEFPMNAAMVSLASLQDGSTKALLMDFFQPQTRVLLSQCSNVSFLYDSAPPWSRFVSISFELDEDGQTHTYQINAKLICRAENMLNEFGDMIVIDDD